MTNRSEHRYISFPMKLYSFMLAFFASEMFGLYGQLNLALYSVSFSHAAVFSLSILMSIYILLKEGLIIRVKRNSSHLVGLLALLSLIEIINTSYIATEQSLILTLTEAFPYIASFFVLYALRHLIQTGYELEYFETLIEKVALFINILSILVFIVYPFINLFPQNIVGERGGLPRFFIGGSTIPTLGILISLIRVTDEKKRTKRSFYNLVVGFIVNIVVMQGRMATISLMWTIVMSVIMNNKIRKGFRKLLIVIAILLLIFSFLATDIDNQITSLFSTDFGIIARIGGIEFFLEKFKEYPLLGMGFITSSQNVDPNSYALLSDSRGVHFHRSDVGIIGLLNLFGLMGVIWFFAYLLTINKNSKLIKRLGGGVYGYVFMWYFVITMINLIITDFVRVLIIPIALCLIEKKLLFIRSTDYCDMRGNVR